MRLNDINFELRRAAVLVAISQVDLTQLRLAQPPQPGVETQVSPTQARDLVQSLGDLLNVQNDFLSVWVNYEVQRMALEFDLGVMELDAAGLRRQSSVPLEAYIAGATRIRECLCNATDLYPGIGQVYEAAPSSQEFNGELIEPLPLEYPGGVSPQGEPLPTPEPPSPNLENPAGFGIPLSGPPSPGGVSQIVTAPSTAAYDPAVNAAFAGALDALPAPPN
jgi:hypothetical protein